MENLPPVFFFFFKIVCGLINSVDSDQTAPRNSLIKVYIVSSGTAVIYVNY